jgi:glycosyltransferase involved in cell wall biosynthesis
MRVVHVIDSGGFYGAEVMLLNLCVEQKKSGIDVEVISIGGLNADTKPIEMKLADSHINVKPWRMRALPDMRESFKILRYCRESNTHAIHSHGYKSNILLGLIPRPLRKIAVVTTVHGYTRQSGFTKLAIYQWLDKICLNWLDAVVIVSPSMMHQVPAKRLEKKLHIISNGIPSSDNIEKESAYDSLFLPHEFKIATLGRLSHEKNFSLVIDAMPIILEEMPHAKLVIYGEGEQREVLEARIQKLKLDSKVLLPGYLHNTFRFFSDIHLFVNSSTTEGMPISLLEAMRQSCPIVATDIAANRFLLEEFHNPQQLCELNPTSLAKAVNHYYHSEQSEKLRLSVAYQKAFEEKYSAALMSTKYTELYSRLLAIHSLRK